MRRPKGSKRTEEFYSKLAYRYPKPHIFHSKVFMWVAVGGEGTFVVQYGPTPQAVIAELRRDR